MVSIRDKVRSAATLFQFLGMGLAWGSSFLFIKVALDGVSFGQVVWSRLILGGLLLGMFMLIGRQRLPREVVVWLHFTVVAITGCVIPYLLISWSELFISSSLASIYNSVTPIATALMVTFALRVEALNRSQFLGVVIGVIGVVVIIAPWQVTGLTGDLKGQLASIGAAFSYGFTFAYMRRFISHRPIPGITVAFMQIAIAGFIMILLTPIVVGHAVSLNVWVVLSLVGVGVLGTGLAYIWNINVLRAWGPTATSTVTYVVPVVGVVLGVLILSETLSWHEPAGALLVLLGILLTQQRIRLSFDWRGRRAGPGVIPATEQDAAEQDPAEQGPAEQASAAQNTVEH